MGDPIEGEWTRRLINKVTKYFKNQGFTVEAEFLDKSKIERDEGVDAVVLVGQKIWGFQTKRLYGNKYKLDEKQHRKIQNSSWIRYAFVEKIDRRQSENILHKTIFSSGTFSYSPEILISSIKDYQRWGDIADGIEKCPIGLDISNEDEKNKLHKDLKDLIEDYLTIMSIDIKQRQIKFVVTNEFLIDKRIFKDFDKERLNKFDTEITKLDKDKRKCPNCGYEFE